MAFTTARARMRASAWARSGGKGRSGTSAITPPLVHDLEQFALFQLQRLREALKLARIGAQAETLNPGHVGRREIGGRAQLGLREAPTLALRLHSRFHVPVVAVRLVVVKLSVT